MAKRKGKQKVKKDFSHPVLGTSISMVEKMFDAENGNGKEFNLPPLIYPDSLYLYAAQHDQVPGAQIKSWNERWKTEPKTEVKETRQAKKRQSTTTKKTKGKSLKKARTVVATASVPQIEKAHKEKTLQIQSEVPLIDAAPEELHSLSTDELTIEVKVPKKSKKKKSGTKKKIKSKLKAKMNKDLKEPELLSEKIKRYTRGSSISKPVKNIPSKEQKKKDVKAGTEVDFADQSEFSHWLQTLKSRSDTRKSMKPSLNIEKEENLVKVSSSASEDKIVNITLGDDIISETLAEVLVSQGHIKAAVKMYEKLSLINPEKSSFFAAKIAQLIK